MLVISQVRKARLPALGIAVEINFVITKLIATERPTQKGTPN